MIRGTATIMLLAFASAAGAEEKPKPNTLTPKEIADGWILLFDGETTLGWKAPNDSKWTIHDGMLAPQASNVGLLMTTTAFIDYELSIEYRVDRGKHELFIGCDGQAEKLIEKVPLMASGGGWWRAEVTVKGSRVTRESFEAVGGGSAMAHKRAIPKEQPEPHPGHIALIGNGMIFRNIKLRPLGAKPLFNAKDLAGWKEHPGKKSNFSVTPEGWLHLKDGPGDLQTEALYDDFILQLECKTNGELLNSGVFFRCRPGEYQQGYEAQIHNGFDADKPKEYVVEEYDPETNELKDKKKVKSPAIDYGTGGIYRRVPARKQAAKDGEWFTMTVIAHGRHVATWVNGIQMVDWTDNRPLKDNARNGCRLEKGAISLQGHDATTDLYFRNIRIAELPKPAEKK